MSEPNHRQTLDHHQSRWNNRGFVLHWGGVDVITASTNLPQMVSHPAILKPPNTTTILQICFLTVRVNPIQVS